MLICWFKFFCYSFYTLHFIALRIPVLPQRLLGWFISLSNGSWRLFISPILVIECNPPDNSTHILDPVRMVIPFLYFLFPLDTLVSLHGPSPATKPVISRSTRQAAANIEYSLFVLRRRVTQADDYLSIFNIMFLQNRVNRLFRAHSSVSCLNSFAEE